MVRIIKTSNHIYVGVSRRLNPSAYGIVHCKWRSTDGYRCDQRTRINLRTGLCYRHSIDPVKTVAKRIKCKGYNSKGRPCKRWGSIDKHGGFCFHHDPNRAVPSRADSDVLTEEYFAIHTLDLNRTPDDE